MVAAASNSLTHPLVDESNSLTHPLVDGSNELSPRYDAVEKPEGDIGRAPEVTALSWRSVVEIFR